MDDVDPGSSQAALAVAADQIVAIGQRMDRFGWVPSIGGNISVRLDAARIAITRSGGRKGFLTRDSVIEVDPNGQPLRADARPSAETLLHCQVYRLIPWAGAVVHGHSVPATVLSRLTHGESITFTGYEMIKGFEGQDTHDTTITLPMFDNRQDMAGLAEEIGPRLSQSVHGYILRGHGVYVWGRDAEQAIVTFEALEFLLECELEMRKAGR